MDAAGSNGHQQPRPLRVMIAERHRTVAESLGRVIGRLEVAEVAATVTTAGDAIEAGSRIGADVAIVDLDLSPNCALVSGLARLSPETRIIVMTDRDNPNRAGLLKALESGAVGAIYKETSLQDLERALRFSSPAAPVVADEAAGLLLGSYLDSLQSKRTRDLATIEALAAAVEVRDATTGKHLERVTELATRCMEQIDAGLAHNEELIYGFTLHDVGKIGIPDAILGKAGPLAHEEWEVMRTHPEIGVRIVEPLGFSSTTTDVILCHHEHFDGTGYPNGLAGEQIPITARAFAVVDAFDAMISDRPYRPAMEKDEAVAVLRSEAGSVHDPDVVDLFVTSVI